MSEKLHMEVEEDIKKQSFVVNYKYEPPFIYEDNDDLQELEEFMPDDKNVDNFLSKIEVEIITEDEKYNGTGLISHKAVKNEYCDELLNLSPEEISIYRMINCVVVLENIFSRSTKCVATKNGCYERKSSGRYVKRVKKRKEKLICDICSRAYANRSSLQNHIKSHTGKPQHKCESCDKIYWTNCRLQEHIRVHNGKRLICDSCGKPFKSRVALIRHIRTHTGEKPYQCDTCKRCFALQKTLREHIRTHTGEKPYECVLCNRRFSVKKILRDHIRTHTGERPFMCPYEGCLKLFSFRNSLRSHIRIHTGEKPYKCNLCDSSYTDKTGLNNHRKRSHYEETAILFY